MPKQSRSFGNRMDVSVSLEMRMRLIAIAYHMGAKGVYAVPARNFISEGIKAYEAGLSGRAKSDYREILQNVKIQVGVPLEELESNKKSPA